MVAKMARNDVDEAEEGVSTKVEGAAVERESTEAEGDGEAGMIGDDELMLP